MRRLLTLMLVMGLSATGCGGGESEDEEGAVAFLREQIAAQSDEAATVQFDEGEALCLAEGMVEHFGAGSIIDASEGTFEEFMAAASEDDRRAVVDLAFGCADVGALMATEMMNQGLSEEAATCIGDGILDSEAFRGLMADSLATGDFEPSGAAENELMEALLPLIFQCVPADELEDFGQ
jgi:hypothetical protein